MECQYTDEHYRILAEAAQALTGELDQQQLVRRLADFLVPHLADWCAIRELDETGRLLKAIVAHSDPEKVVWAEQLSEQYQPNIEEDEHGVGYVLRAGKPRLLPEVTDDLLRRVAVDETHLALLRGVGLRSAIIVPVTAHSQVLGALSLVTAETDRRYGEEELELAMKLGDLFGQLLYNSRLYRLAEERRVALQGSQERLQFILETAQVGVFEWDIATGKVQWSDTLEAVHGLAPGSFGGTFEDFQRDIHPGDVEGVLANISHTLERGDTEYTIEYRIIRTDGEVRWLSARGRVFRQPDGQPTSITGICMDITSRKEAEAKFRQRTHDFYHLLENLPAAAYTCDAEGLITYFNPYAVQVWGREPKLNEPEDRFCGSFRLFLPDGSPIHHDQCWMALALQTGQAQHGCEIVVERPDGSRATALVHAHPLHNENGKLTGAVNVLVDITRRKEAEEDSRRLNQELRDLVNELQTVLNVSPVGIGVAEDPACRVIKVNPAFADMLGIPPESNASKTAIPEQSLPFKVLKNGKEVPSEELPMQVAAARGVHISGEELDHVKEDGSVIHALVSAAPILDETGKPRGSVGAILDITKRKQAEEALREREERYALVLAGAAAAIWDWDVPNQRVLYSPRWKELRGLANDEVTDHESEWSRGIHPDDYDRVMAAVQEHFEGRTPVFAEEYRVRHKDGHWVWILDRGIARRDAAGRVVRMAGSETDITERKRVEEALREANLRKDEFLAMLSHELRNPLAPIASALQLLRRCQDDAAVRQEALGVLDHQVGTLSRLVDDLLDVSRVTTGRIQLQLTEVDLNSLLQRVADSFRPQAAERNQHLSLSLPSTPVWLCGDPTRLDQVVANLISNAIKYTPEGGQVWLTMAEEAGEALITVKDSGVGIDPGLMPHIFELFSQGERALDRTQGGLGIGLPLVKSVVEMHGGTVTAMSEGAGKGSQFLVRLPAEPSLIPESEGPPTEIPIASNRTLRVLLVEDVADSRKVFGRLLEVLGYQVQTAHDGFSALEAALEFRPDVVLLDIGLPGMDGYEVASQMRQEPGLQNVSLVALTGYGQRSDRLRSQQAGFDHHLVKPLDIDALERLLEDVANKAM